VSTHTAVAWIWEHLPESLTNKPFQALYIELKSWTWGSVFLAGNRRILVLVKIGIDGHNNPPYGFN